MDSINPEIIQLGALATISVLLIKEIFAYLRAKKTNGVPYATQEMCNERHKNIDENIRAIRDNHLAHLEEDMKDLREKEIPEIKVELVKLGAKIDTLLSR